MNLRLDVVVLSKGDYKSKARYLPLCLASIKREVKYHRLITVVNSLSERSLYLIEKYGGEVYEENFGSLGKIREYAIRLVDCPFFLFVDDDCILRPNFMEITKYLREDVGGIEGLDYIVNPKRQLFAEALRGLPFGNNSLSRRAFTGDTLIRTEAVKDIRIPRWVKAFEDEYIKRHVENRGYRWIKAVDRYYCDHYDFGGPYVGYSVGVCAKKMGYLTTKQSLINFIKVFPQAAYAWAKTHYWELVPYQVKFYFYCLMGTMCSC